MREQPAPFLRFICLFRLSFYTQLEETASLATLLSCIFQNMWQTSDKLREAPFAIIRLALQWVHVKLKPTKSPQALWTGLQHLQSWIIERPRALWPRHQPLQCLWKITLLWFIVKIYYLWDIFKGLLESIKYTAFSAVKIKFLCDFSRQKAKQRHSSTIRAVFIYLNFIGIIQVC